MAIKLTDANYSEIVENTDKLVLIDFGAEWCGPCRALAPIIEELADEFADKAVICKIDIDENTETAGKYKIRNIPTLIFIKNGEIIHKQVGGASKNDIKTKLQENL